MMQLYRKVTQLRVLGHFFDESDGEFYLRELGRLLDMSPMTVKRALDLLVGDGLVIREERKDRIMYRANVESQSFRFAKVTYNLAWLEEKGIVKWLAENVPGLSSAVLYGSFAKGENDRYSDLDLLLISEVKRMAYTELRERTGLKVNVMNFSGAKWDSQARVNRAFYLDVITEGIVLYGQRPVVE
jgi:predicted nucleotidyltransferase